MITILVSVAAGYMTTEETGWAVFLSLIVFQLLTGDL